MTVEGSVVLTMSINAGGKSGNTFRAFCRSKNSILPVNSSFNPETSISIQKHHSYAGNVISEMSGNS